jgi:hypothetical protein
MKNKKRKKFIIFILVFIIITILLLFNTNKIRSIIEHKKVNSHYIEQNTEITASIIANAQDKSEFYGKIVINYDCPYSEGVTYWKIFYADENNIYLITDDYISSDFCPNSATQTIQQGLHNSFSISNVIKDYSGSSDITNEKIRTLNSNYFAVHEYANYSTNLKAIAYMLDTNVWSVYAGEKAEFAISSPTIEMLLNSYNQKYGVNYQAKSDEIGYRISNNGGLTWDSSISFMLNANDDLYVINSLDKAYRMWLASPTCYSNHYIMCVSNNGSINYDSYDDSLSSFRPVVCLKSDVSLEKKDDNTYIIK